MDSGLCLVAERGNCCNDPLVAHHDETVFDLAINRVDRCSSTLATRITCPFVGIDGILSVVVVSTLLSTRSCGTLEISACPQHQKGPASE